MQQSVLLSMEELREAAIEYLRIYKKMDVPSNVKVEVKHRQTHDCYDRPSGTELVGLELSWGR